MAESLQERGHRLSMLRLELERKSQIRHDDLVSVWNLSVPLVQVVNAGYVRSLTSEGLEALDHYEAVLTSTVEETDER